MDRYYSFIFKGLLSRTALEKTEAKSRAHLSESIDPTIAERLSMELLDLDQIVMARRMGTAYTAIAAFENTLRQFVAKVLLENVSDEWWATCASQKVQKKVDGRIQEEQSIKWHAQRGAEPINYTDFGDLSALICTNWEYFEPHFMSQDWISAILSMLERSRNVIMHSGQLEESDIERVGTIIRDWSRQVGL